MKNNQRLTTAELADVSGLTLRQIQWWVEHRILHPRQAGHRREFDLSEAGICCIAADLRRKGWTLQAVTKIIHGLRGKAIRGGYLVIVAGKSLPHIWLTNDAAAALEVLDGARGNNCGVVDLGRCLEGLRAFRGVEVSLVA